MWTEYVFLVAPAHGVWPRDPAARLGTAAQWWTTAQLRAERLLVEPVALADFIDGYWEGWLPDGEIALE